MTGVPSIVMGLFVYVVWTMRFGYSAFGGALAPRLPDAARRDRLDRDRCCGSCPNQLREASLRARRDEEPHDPDGRAAGGAARHRLGRAARRRARGRRDRAAAVRARRRDRTTTRTSSTRRTPRCRVQIFGNATSSFVAAQDRAWGAALTLVLLTFLVTLAARIVHRAFARGDAHGSPCDPQPNPTARAAPTRARPRKLDRALATEPRRSSSSSTSSRCSTARSARSATSSLQIRKNEITAFIGPSGCGKTTVLRCLNRMNDLIPGARVGGKLHVPRHRPLRPRGLGDRGPPPHRHGVPEAEPVPEEHLRQRRVRPAHQRHHATRRARRDRREVAARAPRCGTRSRTGSTRRRSGCPAASSSACASRARSRSSPRSC